MEADIIAEAKRARWRAALAAVSICIASHAVSAAPAPGAQPPCVKPPPPPCASNDRACIERTFRDNATRAIARYKVQPIRQLSAWQAQLERPLAQRVVPFPAEFFQPPDDSCTWARRAGRPVAADDPLLAEVSHALEKLPAPLQRLAGPRVAAVALADGLEGSATTQELFDAEGHVAAGVIVIDASILRRFTLNSWASWKETLPFDLHDGTRIDVRMAGAAEDSRARLLEYVLSHELGHVLSWQEDAPDAPIGLVQGTGGADFYRLSWSDPAPGESMPPSRFDRAFPRRAELSYYAGPRAPKLDEPEMLDAYRWLPQTNFPDLYAATFPSEDFAESFATYLHVVALRRPYAVTVRRDGEVLVRLGSCWEEARCAGKRKALESFLQRLGLRLPAVRSRSAAPRPHSPSAAR